MQLKSNYGIILPKDLNICVKITNRLKLSLPKLPSTPPQPLPQKLDNNIPQRPSFPIPLPLEIALALPLVHQVLGLNCEGNGGWVGRVLQNVSQICRQCSNKIPSISAWFRNKNLKQSNRASMEIIHPQPQKTNILRGK